MTGLELLMASHLLLKASTEATCPVQKTAHVDVHWRSEPIRYDNTQTTAMLNTRNIDSENPYGVHVAVDVGGLMSGNMKYKTSVQVSSLRYPSAQLTCLWIDRVDVEIVIDPTIQIAAEHPPGSCEYVAILEHENKHVAIDRHVVQSYVESIRAAASKAVQKVGMVGPKADSSADDFKEKMGDYVTQAVKAQADVMYAERARLQKALDNKAEYDRVSARCPKSE